MANKIPTVNTEHNFSGIKSAIYSVPWEDWKAFFENLRIANLQKVNHQSDVAKLQETLSHNQGLNQIEAMFKQIHSRDLI